MEMKLMVMIRTRESLVTMGKIQQVLLFKTIFLNPSSNFALHIFISGWTRRPDGTLVRKTSSWASWSAVSSSDDSFDENDLQSVRKRLEEKTRDLLRHDEGSLPDSVEPGFESSYTQSHHKNAQPKR